jgi:putative serine protease PepD
MKFTIKQSLILGSTLLFLSLIFGYAGAWFYNSNVLDRASNGLQIAGDVKEGSSVHAISVNGAMPSGFEQASASATPSVVFIKTVSTVQYDSPFSGLFWDFDPFGSRGQAASTGSGVIVSKDGYIVTNNHVIQGADKITVVLNKPKNEYTARVIGTDPSSDLAVLKIEANDLPAVAFANSDLVKVGEWVLAVGNPFNLTSTVTAGIVSAKGRNINIVKNQFPIESFIQTDAAINPGNSGGPLVDSTGAVIGINSAIASLGTTSQAGSIGLGFAIPINQGRKIADQLIKYGVATYPVVGISLDVNYMGVGAQISTSGTGILPGSPAQKAGLKAGDVIIEFDGKKINSPEELIVSVRSKNVGDRVTLVFMRDGAKKSVTLNLIAAKK